MVVLQMRTPLRAFHSALVAEISSVAGHLPVLAGEPTRDDDPALGPSGSWFGAVTNGAALTV